MLLSFEFCFKFQQDPTFKSRRGCLAVPQQQHSSPLQHRRQGAATSAMLEQRRSSRRLSLPTYARTTSSLLGARRASVAGDASGSGNGSAHAASNGGPAGSRGPDGRRGPARKPSPRGRGEPPRVPAPPAVRTGSVEQVGEQLDQHLQMQRASAPGGPAPRAGPPRRAQVVKVKLISMGNPGVGKSCLIRRFCEDRFAPGYHGTIGVDYGVKSLSVGPTACRINLFDLAGGPEYLDVRNEFYRDTQGAMLVFDCGDRDSFEALDQWVSEGDRFGWEDSAPSQAKPARRGAAAAAEGGVAVVVVCNKVDRTSQRCVDEEEARAWAERQGFTYIEASARTGQGVDALFRTLAERVVRDKT